MLLVLLFEELNLIINGLGRFQYGEVQQLNVEPELNCVSNFKRAAYHFNCLKLEVARDKTEMRPIFNPELSSRGE